MNNNPQFNNPANMFIKSDYNQPNSNFQFNQALFLLLFLALKQRAFPHTSFTRIPDAADAGRVIKL